MKALTDTIKSADLILKNATVFTLEKQQEFASTVVIRDDMIVFVGDDELSSAFIGEKTRIVDVDKKTVLPGFCDAHCHALMGGRLMNGCLLTGGSSEDEYVEIIREYLRDHEDDSPIFGFGWIHAPFSARGPCRETLDDIITDVAAYFLSIDYHSCWVNSKALEIAGIAEQTEDPTGAYIERYPDSKKPWGCLREMPAIRLVTTKLAQPVKSDWKKALRTYMKKAAQMGITSVFDAGVLNTDQWTAFQAVKEMDDNDELSIRLRGSYVCDPSIGQKQIDDLLHAQHLFGTGNLFKLGVAKLFMDGAVEGHTGFLLESYEDRKDFRGKPVWDAMEYKKMAALLDKEHVQIHVHTIGGGATREALDGIAHAIDRNGIHDARHTLAHLERAAEQDIKRFSELGVFACFQPAWFYMDENYYDETIPLLGKKQADRRYLIEDFMKSDALISFGSDWPWGTVSSTMDPLVAIGTAVTRKDPTDGNRAVYESAQRLQLKSAIYCHCLGGVMQNFLDDMVGTIVAGKKADLVVLDSNIFEKPASDLDNITVDMTIFNGAIIYQKANNQQVMFNVQ